MKKSSHLWCHFMIGVLVFTVIACESREEKAKRLVNTFIEAIKENNIDELPDARAKVLAEGALVVPALLESVVSSDGKTKSEIDYMIEKIGPEALYQNIHLLNTLQLESQLEMLQLISEMKIIRAIPNLIKYIDSNQNKALEFPIARCLAELGSEKGYDLLAEISQSPDREQRFAVALFYNESPSDRALPDIIKRIPVESDNQIKFSLIDTLGKLKNPQVVPLLKKYALEDPKSYEIRHSAAQAIARITGKECKYLDEKGRKVNVLP